MLRATIVRVTAWVILVSVTVVSLELLLQLFFHARHGYWLYSSVHYPVFRKHPWLVGVPREGARAAQGALTITHNTLGFRGKEVSARKPCGKRRIAALGDSTTYGTLVSDQDTWPSLLQERLGPHWEVLNLGVPGYSSVENLIQTALWLSDLEPDIALYYLGWNDIRNSHIQGLKPDYSDFHGPSQTQNLDLSAFTWGNGIASLYYAKHLYISLFIGYSDTSRIEGSVHKFTPSVDDRALQLYVRNVRSIIALNRSLGIRPILVPQVLNHSAMTEDSSNGWVPFVRERDIPILTRTYNQTLTQVAHDTSTDIVEEVLQITFDAGNFADNGHFSRSGNEKFAEVLARFITARASLGIRMNCASPGSASQAELANLRPVEIGTPP